MSLFLGGRWHVVFLAPLWAVITLLPFVFCAIFFGRQHLRISYSDVEVRRTVGLPLCRKSRLCDRIDGWHSSCFDRWFMAQITSKTKDLKKAEVMHKSRHCATKYWHVVQVEKGWDSCMRISRLVLVGSATQQRIFRFLSTEEQEWIADEINLILECINLSPPLSL